MNWIVVWLPIAADELADLWLTADTRAAITAAANRIDHDLLRDGIDVGESRWSDMRVHFESPLGVLFRVQERLRLVEVMHVWRTR